MEFLGFVWVLIPIVSLGYFFMFKRMEPESKYKKSYFFNAVFIIVSVIIHVVQRIYFPDSDISFALVAIAFSFFVIYLTLCFHIGIAAEKKGRNATTFTFFALFLSPLLAGIAVGLMKTDINDQKVSHKNCPMCAELIKLEAVKCKHCGSLLPESA